jgi:hypothetical protein
MVYIKFLSCKVSVYKLVIKHDVKFVFEQVERVGIGSDEAKYEIRIRITRLVLIRPCHKKKKMYTL